MPPAGHPHSLDRSSTSLQRSEGELLPAAESYEWLALRYPYALVVEDLAVRHHKDAAATAAAPATPAAPAAPAMPAAPAK